jgi:hypothetical protein
MKTLHVISAALGWRTLERYSMLEIAGLKFSPKKSVFPALTCPSQATMRTGKAPSEHGVYFNGFWSEDLSKPFFWDQSANIVKGRRIWDDRRKAGSKVGLFFFQQSLGENADIIISPSPIHKHSGGMIMSLYTKPTAAADILKRLDGKFPLWRYWGPFSSPKIGCRIIEYFRDMTEIYDVDEAYLYLPTLDYAAQKYGPDSPASRLAMKEFSRQIEMLSDICMKRSCSLSIEGDYDIDEVSSEPVLPNVMLRKEGIFKVRSVSGMAYPDFYQSEAFAVCDHEVCMIVGQKSKEASDLLLKSGLFEEDVFEISDGRIILTAKKGSWCGYEWWTSKSEAPDFAFHVDIHNKPGFDPKELFLFNRGVVKGTHGRECLVAYV